MQRVISLLISAVERDAAAARCALLRGVGLENVEVVLGEPARGTGQSGSAEALCDVLTRSGLRVRSCHLGGGSAAESDVVACWEKKLEAADRLGAKVVVANAGFAETDQEYRRTIEHLRRLGDCAASYGITVALDTQPGLMQSWRSMRATLEELDHPQLRINFDPGNIVFYNDNADSETSLARVANLVAHVHLHDSAGFGQRGYGPLGRGGGVDFFRLRQVLDVCGFIGPYAIVLDQLPDQPEPSNDEYLQQLAESMENLRWCGYLD